MIVLAHGVFDLLHSGHVDHLMQCRAFGTKLIVSVLADEFVYKPFRINSQATRIKMVAALRCVDQVLVCNAIGPQDILRMLRPDIYARNDEYEDKSKPEFAICEELGIKTCFTVTIPPHTSDLIAKIKAL